jgi:hypothetical protein
MSYLSRKGIIGIAIAVLLVSGAGYLYGTTVAPRNATVLGTTTLTKSATLTETSTVISTATWTETTYYPSPITGQPGSWNQTSNYPLNTSGLSCVDSVGFIYCVGGYNETARENGDANLFVNRTYFAPLSPTGVGKWIRTADYPVKLYLEKCVTSSNYIYCIGGEVALGGQRGGPIPDVYYAPLSPFGIGPWKHTNAYPYPTAVPSCVTDSSYIFCVTANYNGTAYTNIVESYFAPLSSGGLGNWTASKAPPSNPTSCIASGGYDYCILAMGCPPIPPPYDCTSPSYFAPLSPEGMGVWTRTTQLPTSVQGLFVTADSYGYFFGFQGKVFFSRLSSSGIGQWVTSTSLGENPTSCVSNGPYLYCIVEPSPPSLSPDNVYITKIG